MKRFTHILGILALISPLFLTSCSQSDDQLPPDTARRSDLIAGCNGRHHDPPIEGINRLF